MSRFAARRLCTAPTSHRVLYFRDLALRSRNSDSAARLERHGRQMEAEFERRARQATVTGPDGVEVRANPDRTQGQGGYFAPPAWIIQDFASAPRPERVLAALAVRFPLPPNAQSVNLPRLVTGVGVGNESDLDSADDVDLIDASTTSQVVTVAGQSDVALQLLEQSPPSAALDWAIWSDVSLAYDSDLEQQLTYGTGASGQLLGVTQLSGINSVTYTDASPTGAELYPYLGQAGARLRRRPQAAARGAADARFDRAGRGWPRWSTRKAASPCCHRTTASPRPPLPVPAPPAWARSLGFLSPPLESIPATSGTGGNQDQIIACKPSDIILWESEPRTMVGTEVLCGTFQAQNHHAQLCGRDRRSLSEWRFRRFGFGTCRAKWLVIS